MLRIALIGSGFIGNTHADAVLNTAGLELAVIVDISEQAGKKAAEKFGCKYYSDAEEMLQKETIDIVDVCLPTYLHERYVLLAAKYQKHVLCEKPFALTLEACIRMTEACEKASVKFMIAQAARWVPELIEVKKFADTRQLGDLRLFFVSRLAQHPDWTTWHRDPNKSGGCLFDFHTHDIDYLYSLFGPPQKVFAVGWKSPTGCWNHVISTLIFKSGVKAVAEASLEMVGNYPFTILMRLTGDKGTLEYSLKAGFNIENMSSAQTHLLFFEDQATPVSLETITRDPYQFEIEVFANAILNNSKVPIPPRDSIEIMKIVHCLQRSLETGQIIEFS